MKNENGIFYGWWVALVASLTLFLTVGAFYYSLPFLYADIVESMGITRSQVTAGFFIGFTIIAPPFGFLAGTMIDRVGAREVIRIGIWVVGLALLLMGGVTELWQYYTLCIIIVVGYVLSGPIPNQVLIANWFRVKRGQAMGYVYFGLGLGGVVSTIVTPWLIEQYGWRRATQVLGAAILIVLVPLVHWVTRSAPHTLGLSPDGAPPPAETAGDSSSRSMTLGQAARTRNFWLLLGGTCLTLFVIGTVIDHLVFLLKDNGYTQTQAGRVMRILLISSLAGRALVGYLADRTSKKNVMATCYLMLALAVPILFRFPESTAVWTFALTFGFFMGADYMLIPLLTAECFGLASLGKLLAVIIMGYSVGQFFGPRVAAQIFDSQGSYDYAWWMVTAAGILGALAIYCISPGRDSQVNERTAGQP